MSEIDIHILKRIVEEAGGRAQDDIETATIFSIKERGDIATTTDLSVESFVISQLKKRYPFSGFYSEEKGKDRFEDADYVWILDPIDGTKHYVRHNPLFAVSLALEYRRQRTIGLVYLPSTRQLYAAEKGKGAEMNDQPIRCADIRNINQAIVCIEIPNRYSSEEERERAHRQIQTLIEKTLRIRIIGVGSIGLAWTAQGAFDAYVNLASGWKPYDVAAGQVLVEEAEGRFHLMNRNIIAGPPGLCDQLMELLDF